MKFPGFKLSKSWKKSLYGSAKVSPVEVPQGELSVHTHPSLGGLNVSLSGGGLASFSGPDWKLGVSPVGLSLVYPKLLHGDGLHLLQGEDGELGISFDKHSSRHFFLIGKSLQSPKFTLQFMVYLLLINASCKFP